MSAAQLPPLLANSLAVPGTDSERARTILGRASVSRTMGRSRSSSRAPRTRRARSAQTRAAPGRRGHGRADGAVPASCDDGGILFADIQHAAESARRRRAHRRPAARRCASRAGRALVTGQPAIQRDLDRIFASDLRRGELIAIAVALVVLRRWSRALARRGRARSPSRPARSRPRWTPSTSSPTTISMGTYVTNLVVLIGLRRSPSTTRC